MLLVDDFSLERCLTYILRLEGSYIDAAHAPTSVVTQTNLSEGTAGVATRVDLLTDRERIDRSHSNLRFNGFDCFFLRYLRMLRN
jgi:hypothetical protein